MSLKLRLLASIAAALVLTLILGGAVLFWQARAAVRDEIQSDFRVTQHEMRATLAGDTQHTVTMRDVIASMNGQRNVRAVLLNEDNNIIVASKVEPAGQTAPDWFAQLTAPPPLTARIGIPLQGFACTLLLESDASSETGEIWQLVCDAFLAMVLFSAITLLFVWLIVERSLRFLHGFQSGLGTVSDGDYDARLPVSGAPEFAALADGFNHMAARLSSYRGKNQRLQQQILSVQEEERAEIARDLHDEVGPYLFAIQVDADAVAKSGNGEARERAGTIREAALHVQRHVKQILRQLRPVTGLDFGLETAVDDLIAFWKSRHPGIRFERQVHFGLKLDRRSEEAAYRIVQESISNAVRHGHPKSIRILLTGDKDGVSLMVEDDGNGFAAATGESGMGLKGMAERVRALNGQFAVENRTRGVQVRAVLPRAEAREMEQA